MSKAPLDVMFMPWADLKTERKVGPFRIWAWDKSRVADVQIADHLDQYFKGHVDQYGNPVFSITILSADEGFAPISNRLLQAASFVVDMLFLAVDYPDLKAAVRMGNRSMVPTAADRFQLVRQRFTPGDKSFAVLTDGLIHAGQIGKLKVTRPWNLGGFGFPDEELLQGLSGLFRHSVKPDVRERIKRSLEWFRLAHTSSEGASALSKIVMMATAFEILLQIPEGPGKTSNFIDAIERRVLRSRTKSKVRKVPVRSGKNAGTTKTVTRSLPSWWANDFYDLRSRVVHGDLVESRRLRYKGWLSHLMVADLAFGECLEYELYDLKLIGDDIRKNVAMNCASSTDASQQSIEQSLKDWLQGHSDIHRKLGWSPK